MKHLRIRQSIVALCCACGALSAGAVSYTAVDIGTLGGRDTFAAAMNPSGWVTGFSYLPGDTSAHAFLWNGTSLRDLGTLGGSASNGNAINASGWVTGASRTADPYGNDYFQDAFLWDGSSMRAVGGFGSGWDYGRAINESGWIAGTAMDQGDTADHAFLWDGSSTIRLGDFYAPDGYSSGINSSGWVTGATGVRHRPATYQYAFLWNGSTMQYLDTPSYGRAINSSGWVTGSNSHAFVWNGTVLHDLGTLGGTSSGGNAINASGWVTGGASLAGDEAFHAFLWNGSSMQDLGTLGMWSTGNAINSSGWVVGDYRDTADFRLFRAFVWNGAGMMDLSSALPPGSPFVLTRGVSINDAGQILAQGENATTGEYHAFVLSPLRFTFAGFFAPVANSPLTNFAKAGRAEPLKFSLGGNQGLDVFAPGYPASRRINCASHGGLEANQPTATAGASGLHYDAATGQYTYVWKTQSAWANTCRLLTVRFTDGTEHEAIFQFK